MRTSEINNPIFRTAVEAMDAGNLPELMHWVDLHPALLRERLVTKDTGYFKDPYLLYFVADNPIRMEKMPPNIVEVTRALVATLASQKVASISEQLDYTLGLVATGRIPKECGVQVEMMDLLMDAGAKPDSGLGALAHGNPGAARHLTERGAPLTLATAVGLDRGKDVRRLAPAAGPEERLVALTVAAFQGQTDWLAFLLELGVDPSGYPKPVGFHSHATPLHQAVSSGSLASVQLLVEAGADLALKDKIHRGTPLGWAKHIEAETIDGTRKKRYTAIREYLETRARPDP